MDSVGVSSIPTRNSLGVIERWTSAFLHHVCSEINMPHVQTGAKEPGHGVAWCWNFNRKLCLHGGGFSELGVVLNW